MLLNKRYHLPTETAFAKSSAIKSSVQKVNLVASLIRGSKIADAMLQLRFCKKKVAKEIEMVLKSAVANAEANYGYDIDRLYVSEILVGKAFFLKRLMANARGRASRIKKPYSKVSVFVSIR